MKYRSGDFFGGRFKIMNSISFIITGLFNYLFYFKWIVVVYTFQGIVSFYLSCQIYVFRIYSISSLSFWCLQILQLGPFFSSFLRLLSFSSLSLLPRMRGVRSPSSPLGFHWHFGGDLMGMKFLPSLLPSFIPPWWVDGLWRVRCSQVKAGA